MSTAEQITETIQEGAEVVSWGRYGQKCANFKSGGVMFSIPVWSTKIYIAIKRQADGVLTWRLKSHVGPTGSGRDGNAKVEAFFAEYPGEKKHVSHGWKCNP